jgi:phthalate 4,5-cis-dihydrodiol dehydrogenase
MITALNYTDFLYRPRRPEELATESGGGVVFSQGAHQVDIVRLLGGGRVTGVRALTGAWDPARPTEGAYAALLTFADGAFASLVYSGYAHFDADEFCGGIGELGTAKNAARTGGTPESSSARRMRQRKPRSSRRATMAVPVSAARAIAPTAPWHEHFGVVLVSATGRICAPCRPA